MKPSGKARYAVLMVFRETWGDEPPWPCYFCGRPVTHYGRDIASLDRHHIDGDKENNSPANVVPSHQLCHKDWHISPYEVIPFTLNQRGVIV
jgi:hypothetical protein